LTQAAFEAPDSVQSQPSKKAVMFLFHRL